MSSSGPYEQHMHLEMKSSIRSTLTSFTCSQSSMESTSDRLAAIKALLGKRSTFTTGTQQLQQLLPRLDAGACNPQLFDVLQRAMTVLRTRITSPALWQDGVRLFAAAESEPPPRPQGLSDLLELAMHPGGLPVYHAAGDSAEAAAGQGGGDDVAGQRQQAQRAELEAAELEDLHQRIQEALLASEVEADARPGGPPPASKYIVSCLPVETLTPERLQQLGGHDVQCAVCREGLAAGDKVKVMPCKHALHPDCLGPWLKQHNSCPICRHELPTDDDRYELAKAREAQAQEDRLGAAAALPHNELDYL